MAFFSFGIVASAPVFDPTAIEDIELWLDASDAATITETSGNVSQWDDKSGNNRDVVQATAIQQPSTSVINGNDSLLFDGLLTRLRLSGLNPAVGISPVSYAVVVTPTTIVGTSDDAFRLRDGFTNRVSFLRNNNDVVAFADASAGTDLNLDGQANVLAADTSRWFITRIRNVGDGDSDILDSEGNELSESGPTTLFATADDINIGANANGANAWAGHIHELIVYNRFITGTERTSLQSYLNGKWSV